MLQDIFDHVHLRWLDERYDLHLAAALWTRQWVDFAGLLVDRARLISIAQVWLLRVAAAAEVASSRDGSADASTSTFLRMPRDLLEYQPPL